MPVLSLSISITPADKAAILTKIGEIKALMPFLINLTPQERKRLRKKGTKRTGYVNDVYQAVQNNQTVIPATFNVAAYKQDKFAGDDLTDIDDQLIPLFEGISDTLLLLGVELMKQSDSGYDYLKRAAKDNASIQAIVEQIAKAFAGQGKKKTPVPA